MPDKIPPSDAAIRKNSYTLMSRAAYMDGSIGPHEAAE